MPDDVVKRSVFGFTIYETALSCSGFGNFPNSYLGVSSDFKGLSVSIGCASTVSASGSISESSDSK